MRPVTSTTSTTSRYGTDEAWQLHVEAPAIDLHADPLIWSRYLGYDLNLKHAPPLPWAWFGGHVDVPRMLAGGMGAQFFGLVAVPGVDLDAYDTCNRQIDLLEQAVTRSEGRLVLATTAQQVEQQPPGTIAALLGVEGAHILGGRAARLDVLYERGVRYLGLVHFTRNECGAPAFGVGADAQDGLTRFGNEIVERCQSLGIIVDLAHLNYRGFMDVCEVSKRPVYCSHTGVSGVFPMWRNIEDEQLRAVAKTGGAVGVIFCPRYLGKDGVEAVVDHLIHIINVAGEDTPALGSDWDGFIRPTQGLHEASRLPCLTDALLRRGVGRDVIKKILRGNALRVLREVANP